MTRDSSILLLFIFIFATTLGGCTLQNRATSEMAVSRSVVHDTVVQVRDILKIDSVYIYHGHGLTQSNDTVFITDTIREVRIIKCNHTDTVKQIVKMNNTDTLRRSETIVRDTEKRSTWNNWTIFTTIYFCLSIVFLILYLIFKTWKRLRK